MMPYSQDLRLRVIAAYQNQEGSYSTLGTRFQVHWHTVRNWIKAVEEEERFTPKAHQSGNRSPLQEEHREYLEALYAANCDLSHQEVCDHLQKNLQIHMSVSSLSSALKRLQITRKKNTVRSQEKGRIETTEAP